MTERAVILPSFVRSTNKSKTEFSEFQQAWVPPQLHPGRREAGFYADELTVPLMDRCQSLAGPRAAPHSGRLAPHLICSLRQTALTAILLTRVPTHGGGELVFPLCWRTLCSVRRASFLIFCRQQSQTCQEAAANPKKKKTLSDSLRLILYLKSTFRSCNLSHFARSVGHLR